MASRHEYEMLFKLNAQLGGSYSSTFKSAQGAIASMQKEIAALSKIQSDITSYQKQQNAIEASRKKLAMLQQQYDNIQKEMTETGTYSSALENKLLSKQQQIDRTTSSLSAQTAKLQQMGNALRDAGIDTANLSEESAKLSEQIETLKDKQEEAADKANNFGSAAAAAFGAAGQAITAAGITIALKEIVEFYGEATEASMVFESAMTGVSKTTEMSDEELAAMAEEIKDLSTNIPIVTEELAAIGEVAGQLGIAKENLLDFSTIMAMLATATTMTPEEGATLLAQFANITQMDPSKYSNLASAIVDLGNNYATTEQKITEMAQGIAASASLAGMSEADMLALSAAVTSLGIETQAGSTAMSKLISDLMTAVETGDNLKEFAKIANMSAKDFKAAWGDNAVTALQAFVVGLTDTERNGKSATVALTELGITEARMQRMILSLANSGDLLNRTLDTANEAWAENTALIVEAEKRYATTQSQLTMRQNAYNNLKIAIGDDLNPVLKDLYKIEKDVLKNLTEFVEDNPELVRAVTAFAGVIGLAAGGLAAYVAIVKVAIPLTSLFTATIPGLNVIMGVTVGVAALTAGIAAFSGETDEARIKMEEFIAENDALIDSHNELFSSLTANTAAINDQELGTLALVYKLKELSEKTSLSAVEQEQMKAIVDSLNESVPDLALSYDEVTHSLNMSTEAIERMVLAQAKQELQAENYRKWVELTKEELKLSEQLAEAQEKLDLKRQDSDAMEYTGNLVPRLRASTELSTYISEVKRLETAYAENQAALADVTKKANEYAAALNELQTEMDMNEEAAKSGENTIQGFIAGAEDMLPEVQRAYAQIAQAAVDAIDAKLQIKSPSRVMMNRAEMAWSGYIQATEAMQTDVAMAMAETAGAGVNAVAIEAIPSTSGGGNGALIELTVAPVYNLSGGGAASDIAAMLKNTTEDLKEQVLAILEEAGIDAARRAYT